MKYGKDYIGVSVSAMIFDEKSEQILVARRSDNNPRFPDVWEFVGGKLELGEGMDSGVKREVKEEVGLEVNLLAWLIPTEYIGDGTHFINCMAICQIISGEPKVCEPEKCSEVRWVKISQLLNHDFTLAEYCTEDIKNLKKYLKK